MLTNGLFWLRYNVANFIFLLICRQLKVDLNSGEKLLVFVKIRQKNSSLRTVIIYENFKFTQEYAFAERCCILTFSFEGKLKEYDISLKRKYMKNNKNMIFSVLFRNVHQPENSFFHAVITT